MGMRKKKNSGSLRERKRRKRSQRELEQLQRDAQEIYGVVGTLEDYLNDGNYEKALAKVETSINKIDACPNSAPCLDLLIQRADLKVRFGDAEKAQEIFDKALEVVIVDDNDFGTNIAVFRATKTLAKRLRTQRRWEDAITIMAPAWDKGDLMLHARIQMGQMLADAYICAEESKKSTKVLKKMRQFLTDYEYKGSAYQKLIVERKMMRNYIWNGQKEEADEIFKYVKGKYPEKKWKKFWKPASSHNHKGLKAYWKLEETPELAPVVAHISGAADALRADWAALDALGEFPYFEYECFEDPNGGMFDYFPVNNAFCSRSDNATTKACGLKNWVNQNSEVRPGWVGFARYEKGAILRDHSANDQVLKLNFVLSAPGEDCMELVYANRKKTVNQGDVVLVDDSIMNSATNGCDGDVVVFEIGLTGFPTRESKEQPYLWNAKAYKSEL